MCVCVWRVEIWLELLGLHVFHSLQRDSFDCGMDCIRFGQLEQHGIVRLDRLCYQSTLDNLDIQKPFL